MNRIRLENLGGFHVGMLLQTPTTHRRALEAHSLSGSHRRLTARIGTAMYWAPEARLLVEGCLEGFLHSVRAASSGNKESTGSTWHFQVAFEETCHPFPHMDKMSRE